MFIVAQFFSSLAMLFGLLFKILYFLLVVRIILSWFQVDPYSGPAQVLYQITDPILAPFQRIPFLRVGPLDLSPIVAFFVLNLLGGIIVNLFLNLASRFSG